MPLWTSVGEAPDHTSPTRNALPSPHLDLLREMSDTTGHRVVMETCAVASRAFREHHLNVWAFEVGLVNILLSCFILGASAAYFLLYALVQTPFLFYLVYRSKRKDGRLLDFVEVCWFYNFVGWVWLACEFGSSHDVFGGRLHAALSDRHGPEWEPALRRQCARSFFLLANGPLLFFATCRCALVFHDVQKMVSMFIHFFPAVVSWLIRWSPHEVMLLWPGIFGLSAKRPDATAAGLSVEHSVLKSALGLYFIWWSAYGVWLLMDGCKWAERYQVGSCLDDFAPLFSKIFGIKPDSHRLLAVAYLSIHAAGSTAMLWLTTFLYESCVVHTAAMGVACICMIHRGACHYHHEFGPKFDIILKNVLETEVRKSL